MPRLCQRAVFLDRDGVVNEAVVRDGKPHPPPSVAEIQIPCGVLRGCQELKRLGFLLLVVTNQPDIARGSLSASDLAEIHSYLRAHLPLDDIYTCLHDDPDNCSCRKPLPGLILQAASRYRVDLSASWMVGDRSKDIAAGRAAGCRTILLRTEPYAEESPVGPDAVVSTFAEVVTFIARQPDAREGQTTGGEGGG